MAEDIIPTSGLAATARGLARVPLMQGAHSPGRPAIRTGPLARRASTSKMTAKDKDDKKTERRGQ